MAPGIWQLLIVLLIVLLLFGTKKLRNLGKDLGETIKGFKDATKGDSKPEEGGQAASKTDDKVIEGEVTAKERESGKEKNKV